MPNARLLEADSLVELRMHPERLTGEIARVPGRGLVGRQRQARAAAANGRAAPPPGSRVPGAAPPAQRVCEGLSWRSAGLGRGEQFEFVDGDVAGRLRRADEAAGALLIHSVRT